MNKRGSISKSVVPQITEEEEEEKEEKKEISMRRSSKYFKEKKGNPDIFKHVRGRSNANQTKKIIVFRSKSKEKKEVKRKIK